MLNLTIDHQDPVRSLARILGTDGAVHPGGLLSVTIDRRLPMSAAVGTQGALDLCFELGTLSRLDDAAIFGAMEEVARWRSSTVPALLEVLEDELVLLWSPQIDRGAALLADLCSLVATCLAIREMFELRATQPTVGTPDMQDRHSGASKQLRGAMLHGGRPAKAS